MKQTKSSTELYIILGNGLLLCRWSQRTVNKLKFVNFYPWKSFFSISNRPGKKILICTFKLKKSNLSINNTSYDSSQSFQSHPYLEISQSNSLSYIDTSQYRTQKDLRLPLKSAKLAELIARKLSQYVRASQRQ